MNNIPPYIKVKSNKNGFWFYHFLHIQGGEGHGKKGLGGRFRFTVCYLTPDECAEMGSTSAECFCEDRKIPCGGGDTIQEAYNDFQHQLIRLTLK